MQTIRNALNYLILRHDESTGKMILDEFNRPCERDELYVDGPQTVIPILLMLNATNVMNI